MNTKHTPGPWRVEDNEGSLRILAPDERATIICEGVGPASNESAKADARLIASSPDLLVVCQQLADLDLNGTDDSLVRFIVIAHQHAAKNAIAKATQS